MTNLVVGGQMDSLSVCQTTVQTLTLTQIVHIADVLMDTEVKTAAFLIICAHQLLLLLVNKFPILDVLRVVAFAVRDMSALALMEISLFLQEVAEK
jgi:hypothetical protein